VCVLERSHWLGGAIRTAEISEPGFLHEVFSGWHTQFLASQAYEVLGEELATRGVRYVNTHLPTATLYPDGESFLLTTSHTANVAEFERWAPGDGAAWDATVDAFVGRERIVRELFETELMSRRGMSLALRAYRSLGRNGMVELGGTLLESCRDWVTRTFHSERAHGLFAPWVLHSGFDPDAAGSGFAARTITVAKELNGSPTPVGGGTRLVESLAGIIRDMGGACETERDVERVVVSRGRARGVQTADGETIGAKRAVIANVTPQQLYSRLLRGMFSPNEAPSLRFGLGGMMIHMALSEAPRWADERIGHAAVVHLTSGLEGVSRAVNEARRGLLPANATIVCGQHCAVDPSRAPAGKWTLWIQLQELPARPRGDAGGILEIDERIWTERLRESYADRIQARIAAQATNLEAALRRRIVLSPSDLERANVNLVDGDMYSGACSLDQSLLWRPRGGAPGGHETPIATLFHIGASTHPGPGLGGGSGMLVARKLLGRQWRRVQPRAAHRLRSRIRR
jgi:phytoene dehydrogenase-like protein